MSGWWTWGPLVFAWVVAFFWAWLAAKWEGSARRGLEAADRLRQERDRLADWLNILGWEVQFLPEKTVIERRTDPEEERLAR